MAGPDLVIFDADGEDLAFDAAQASSLFTLTGNLDAATVSACPASEPGRGGRGPRRSHRRRLPPFARSDELLALADDSPTLHLYVRDLQTPCVHRTWLDPGAEEWADLVAELAGPSILR